MRVGKDQPIFTTLPRNPRHPLTGASAKVLAGCGSGVEAAGWRTMQQQAQPGWYEDPEQPGQQRYWTGDRWTTLRRPASQSSPPPPPPPPGPSQQRPPPAYQPSPWYRKAERRRHRRRLIAILGAVTIVVVLAIVVVVVATSSTLPGGGTTTHPAAADVSISSCSVGAHLIPQATGTIVNHSSGTSDYSFTVSFLNQRGDVVAQGSGGKNHIASEQAAAWAVMGEIPNDGPLTCRLDGVSRLASR